MPASAMSTNPLRAAVCEDCETAVALEEKSFNRWRKGLFRGGKSIQDWRKAVVGALSKAKAGDRLAGPGGGRLTAAQASRFHEVAQGLQATSGGYDRAGDLGALNSGSLPGLKSYGNAADYQSHQEPMWQFLDQKGLAAHGRWKSPAQASVIGAANPEDFDYIVVQGHANASASPGGPKFVAGQATIGVGADRRRPAYASPNCKHDAGGHAAEGSDPVRVGRFRWPWSRVGDGTSDGKKAMTGVDSVVVGGPSSKKKEKPSSSSTKSSHSATSSLIKGPDPGLKPSGAAGNWSGAVLKRDPPLPQQDPQRAPGWLHLYKDGSYVGKFRANENGYMPRGKSWSSWVNECQTQGVAEALKDETNVARGVPPGTYTLQPKQTNGNFAAGTPAITGKGQPIGKPGAGFQADAILLHQRAEALGLDGRPIPDSLACVTVAQQGKDMVADMMNSAPNKTLPFIVK